MAKYLKPQTPLQHQSGDYIYPITTIDQVLMDNGERLNANIINIQLDGAPEDNINFGINADTLGGQKPEYYATAEDLVALNDSKLSMELLWENASPSSEFAAQTINLDLNAYDRLKMDFYHQYDPGTLEMSIGTTVSAHRCYIYDDGGVNMSKRTITTTESSIKFNDAVGLYRNFNGVAALTKPDNTALAPTRIYGIRGVSA